ncbi:DotI/IcmL/TraM family protein [Facilibium subflavum]|uniref:DotI/IcmL/TraM family protein n=1 Tax=Facilibium subflavum TaxID=2219058 RepID=UPI000E64E526|nr:DotI/IcmL/TraM family protein [Facilibium subflavum]
MKKTNQLQKIIARNDFYQTGFRRLWIAFIIVLIANIILVVSVFSLLDRHSQSYYFASTVDGRVIPLRPLSQPLVSDDKVKSWTVQALNHIYQLDFVNYAKEFSANADYFTNAGWKNFSQAFFPMLQKIKKQQLVMNAITTDEPIILSQGIIDGIYTWVVQVPVSIHFVRQDTKTTSDVVITLTIQRKNQQDTLLAIRQFIQESKRTS